MSEKFGLGSTRPHMVITLDGFPFVYFPSPMIRKGTCLQKPYISQIYNAPICTLWLRCAIKSPSTYGNCRNKQSPKGCVFGTRSALANVRPRLHFGSQSISYWIFLISCSLSSFPALWPFLQGILPCQDILRAGQPPLHQFYGLQKIVQA